MNACPVCGLGVGEAKHCSTCGASWGQVNLRRTFLWVAVIAEYAFLAALIVHH
jgi:hypothetical protein